MPSHDTPRIQEGHVTIIHIICDLLEKRLFKAVVLTLPMARKAVFIDRDGTINEESGYLHRKEDCRFIPGAIEAIAQLNTAGFLVVVVTNQSGIARGYYSEDDLEKLHLHVVASCKPGARIDGWYHCPHHPDYPSAAGECDCRKPLPGMLQRAAQNWGLILHHHG